jgi:hypothetical protein
MALEDFNVTRLRTYHVQLILQTRLSTNILWNFKMLLRNINWLIRLTWYLTLMKGNYSRYDVAGSEIHCIVRSGKSSIITIIWWWGKASGNCVPSYAVFPGARMWDDMLMGISHDTVETVSESGWSNSEIFLDYLKYHFIKYINILKQKVSLLLDEHI